MKKPEELDQLLKQALSPTVEPKEALNNRIINQLRERDNMRPVLKRKLSVVLMTAVITLLMSVTAFAAWRLLSPKQVAEHFGDERLASAFEDKNAILLNKSVVSGGYNFTLLGIVSGEGLSDFPAQDVNPDRTYAVVSIARADGTKMPEVKDEEYDKVPFFISPLVKGQKPWQVNIASMKGAYASSVIDGIMYRLIECDGVEMFADRGLYLCISTSNFYDINAFSYDENTGEITPKAGYQGANALFDLPVNPAKADHEKAEKYLEELLNPSPENSEGNERTAEDLEKEFADGAVIPESVKEVTYDENGMAWYEYDSLKISENIDFLFEGKPMVTSKILAVQEADGVRTAVRFSRDAKGVVTAMMVKAK